MFIVLVESKAPTIIKLNPMFSGKSFSTRAKKFNIYFIFGTPSKRFAPEEPIHILRGAAPILAERHPRVREIVRGVMSAWRPLYGQG